MFIASSVWVALILIILVFRGGGAVPPPADELRPGPSGGSLPQQAEALVAQGDYEGAWNLYYQALQAAPEDVSLWYGLGVTLSHLKKRKETEEAFQYVVRHGRPDSEEVRVARNWLRSAGVLVKPVAFAVAAEPAVEARGEKAALSGKVTWGAPQANRPPLTVRLLLHGLSGPAGGKRFYTRAVLGETYRFEGLPGGSYRLIGAAAGQRLWDLTFVVENAKEAVLDLGKDNSSTPTIALYQ